MNGNKITENTKLIAEFMGLSVKKGVCYYTDEDDMYPMGIEVEEPFLPYDESWDWLMPVLFKIKSLQHRLNKESNLRNGSILWYGGSWIKIEANYEMDVFGEDSFPAKDGFSFKTESFKKCTEIETMYEGIVEFIKWYNQQKVIMK